MKRQKVLTRRLMIPVLLFLVVLSFGLISAKRFDLPGSYPANFAPWNDSVDSVSFSWKIDPAQYTNLVVLPVNRTRLRYDRKREPGDPSNEIINIFLNQITPLYGKALSQLEGNLQMPMEQGNLRAISNQTLVLQTDVLIVDPGLDGPNAGTVTLKMEARFIDGGSRMELTKFSHTVTKKSNNPEKALEQCIEELAGDKFASVIYSLLGK